MSRPTLSPSAGRGGSPFAARPGGRATRANNKKHDRGRDIGFTSWGDRFGLRVLDVLAPVQSQPTDRPGIRASQGGTGTAPASGGRPRLAWWDALSILAR